MNDKKEIILKEIEYWKKNKILPKHYCDFLRALYEEETTFQKGSNKTSYLFLIISILLSMAIIGFLGYYFNDFSRELQIALFCVLFFLGGVLLKIFYIQFIGLFALIGFMGWSSLPFIQENFSWFLLEGSWIGVSFLFLLASWLILKINKKLSLNLYIHGILLLFVPSMQALYIEQASVDMVQLLLFSKLIFLALFLFLSRRVLDKYINFFS